jgi:hypothetical protein
VVLTAPLLQLLLLLLLLEMMMQWLLCLYPVLTWPSVQLQQRRQWSVS